MGMAMMKKFTQKLTAEGLFDVVQQSLKHLGIQSIDIDNCKKLVGLEPQ